MADDDTTELVILDAHQLREIARRLHRAIDACELMATQLAEWLDSGRFAEGPDEDNLATLYKGLAEASWSLERVGLELSRGAAGPSLV